MPVQLHPYIGPTTTRTRDGHSQNPWSPVCSPSPCCWSICAPAGPNEAPLSTKVGRKPFLRPYLSACTTAPMPCPTPSNKHLVHGQDAWWGRLAWPQQGAPHGDHWEVPLWGPASSTKVNWKTLPWPCQPALVHIICCPTLTSNRDTTGSHTTQHAVLPHTASCPRRALVGACSRVTKDCMHAGCCGLMTGLLSCSQCV